MLEVVVYQDARGIQPFTNWHDELEAHAATRIDTAIRRIAEGNLSDSKGVGAGVMERRLHLGAGLSHLLRPRRRLHCRVTGWRHEERTAKRYR
jgi:putative addiction module killer protein